MTDWQDRPRDPITGRIPIEAHLGVHLEALDMTSTRLFDNCGQPLDGPDPATLLRIFAEIEWHVQGPARDYDPGEVVGQSGDREMWASDQAAETAFHVRRLALSLAALLGFSEADVVEAEKAYREKLLKETSHEK